MYYIIYRATLHSYLCKVFALEAITANIVMWFMIMIYFLFSYIIQAWQINNGVIYDACCCICIT